MAAGDKIKCKVQIESKRFYNADSDFGIVLLSVLELEEGEPVLDNFGCFIAKGMMPEPKVGGHYLLTATEVNDPKWGKQYQIVNMCTSVSLEKDDKQGQRVYLETIFTTQQVEAMYEALENPFESFSNDDVAALLTIKGCGIKTAPKWLAKFKLNIEMSRIYVGLQEYELTANMVKKLYEYYGSADLVIQNVKKNPYSLIDLKGIGWKKCDELAQKGGMGVFCSERVEAFIKHYLEQMAEAGYTYVYSNSQLMDAIVENLGEDIPDEPIIIAIKHLGDKLWWSEDQEQVGLSRYIGLERKIAEKLIELSKADNSFKYENWEQTIKRLEELQGWEFTDQQLDGIKAVLEKNVVIITGFAGCVDCDTEYFNGREWKRIADYTKDEEVLQYNSDGTANLIKPKAYIKNKKEKLWHFRTKYGLDQCLSEDHNCYYITSKGNLYSKSFSKVKADQENKGFFGKFITTFQYNGTGIKYNEFEIRYLVMQMADGHFNYKLKSMNANTYNKCIFRLKKERKIKRFKWIMENLGWNYEEHYEEQTEFSIFKVYSIERFKHYPSDWYEASQEQLQIIADEVVHWDGSDSRKEFYTGCKTDADFIQFAITSVGYRTTIQFSDRRGQEYKANKSISNKPYIRKSVEYVVKWTDRTLIQMTHDKRPDHTNTPIEEYFTKDGYEYCFNVDSGKLVLRRGDKIFITGNCGKTSLVEAMLEVLRGYSFAQCALAGRAAARLAEVTHQDGYTIHRLLGFPKGDDNHGGFIYHEDNPLEYDIIILDEISMVDGQLFYSLLRAIKPGTKLILLGDVGQLESIGCSNIAHDLIESPEIKSVQLDKIHRQAEASAIITDSIKARKNLHVIEKDWVGVETRGDLQDLTYDCFSDVSNTFYKVMQYVSEYISSDVNILDLQVIVPIKERDAGTWNLNLAIQEIYNPLKSQDELLVKYDANHAGYLRVGDKVMNMSNNYKCVTYEGQWECERDMADEMGVTTPVYNGNIGIVSAINSQRYEIVVDFVDIGRILISKDKISSIMLGYAITTHKFQGSAAPYVVIGLDFSSYSLLTKELFYTAITRASKKCIVVAQTGALRYLITQNGVSNKQTLLQDFLYEVGHPKLTF